MDINKNQDLTLFCQTCYVNKNTIVFFKFTFSFHDKRKIARHLLCSWFCQLSNEIYCL